MYNIQVFTSTNRVVTIEAVSFGPFSTLVSVLEDDLCLGTVQVSGCKASRIVRHFVVFDFFEVTFLHWNVRMELDVDEISLGNSYDRYI